MDNETIKGLLAAEVIKQLDTLKGLSHKEKLERLDGMSGTFESFLWDLRAEIIVKGSIFNNEQVLDSALKLMVTYTTLASAMMELLKMVAKKRGEAAE